MVRSGGTSSGRKRASTSTKRTSSAGANPDFKKIKAKVGRRAPRPANQTDTTVQFDSLRLCPQGQFVDGELHNQLLQTQKPHPNDSRLLSSRGSSVSDLVSKLHHPAVNVRLSAIKGLKDIVHHLNLTKVDSNSLSSILSPMLQQNLSTIITAVTRGCCVDEAEDVRVLALSLLEETLTCLGTGQQAERLLLPLSSLTIALIQTSLNSLDRDTVRSGVAVTELLSRRVPGVLSPAVGKLLPSFVRCFEERSSPRFAGRQHQKEAKTNSSITSVGSRKKGGDVYLLQALLTLLSTRHHRSSQEISSEFPKLPTPAPYVELGSIQSSYAFVIARSTSGDPSGKMARRCVAPLQKLTDMTTFECLARHQSVRFSEVPSTALSSANPVTSPLHNLDPMTDLMEHMRDILFEAIQASNHVNAEGASMPMDQVERVLLVACVIRTLASEVGDGRLPRSPFQLFSTGMITLSERSSLPSRFNKVNSQILTALLDVFPLRVQQQHSSSVIASGGATMSSTTVNSEISRAILSIIACCATSASAPAILSPSERLLSSHAVLRFVNQSLFEVAPGPHGNRLEDGVEQILELLGIMVCHQSVLFADENAHHLERVLERFVTTYFRPSEMTVLTKWARSVGGRQAVRLAIAVFREYHFDLPTVMERIEAFAVGVFESLPDYLMLWGSDFPSDTNAALSLLHEMLQKHAPAEIHKSGANASGAFLREIAATRLSALLEWHSFRKEGGDSDAPGRKIIFEEYEESSQRLVIAVLELSGQLRQATVHAWGTICSRSHRRVAGSVSLSMANLILESVFRLRKTIPLSSFLGYLVDAMGVTNTIEPMIVKKAFEAGKEKSSEVQTLTGTTAALNIVELDRSAKTTMRLLLECGSSTKILCMLRPFLSMCMSQGSESRDCSTPLRHCDVVRLRIALAVVALLSRECESDSITSASTMPDDLQEQITDACFALVLWLWESRRVDAEADPSPDTTTRIVQPLLALLSAVPTMFSSMFLHVLNGCKPSGSSGPQNSNDAIAAILPAFAWLLKLPGFDDLARDRAAQWLTVLYQSYPNLYSRRATNAPESAGGDDPRTNVALTAPAPLQRLALVLQALQSSSSTSSTSTTES